MYVWREREREREGVNDVYPYKERVIPLLSDRTICYISHLPISLSLSAGLSLWRIIKGFWLDLLRLIILSMGKSDFLIANHSGHWLIKVFSEIYILLSVLSLIPCPICFKYRASHGGARFSN